MASPDATLEHLLIRTTTLGVVLQGVLVELHAFDPASTGRIRRRALDLAADLQAHSGSGAQVGGERLDADIQAFLGVIEA